MAAKKSVAVRHAAKESPKVVGAIAPFTTVGDIERYNIGDALKRRLSGYLGGVPRGGYWVERLSAEWCEHALAPYAIPCNSATSGLMAACMAVGIKPGDEVWVTNYSMSATAACAMVLGAKVKFIDIEAVYFGLNPLGLIGRDTTPKAVIVTNLFGHPAQLEAIAKWCETHGVYMIEDNAQAPFAYDGQRYTGTVGHLGVFSLNVHKHLQCGEGGVVVTSNDDLAMAVRHAINHGELAGYAPGLNMRMTEVTAAIACAQLAKKPAIIGSRVALGHKLTEMVDGIPWLTPPKEREGCLHVYYIWAAKVDKKLAPMRRQFTSVLRSLGFPMRSGYSIPLNAVFDSSDVCPTTDLVESQLICFETCAYDPSKKQLSQMRDVIRWAAEELDGYVAKQDQAGR